MIGKKQCDVLSLRRFESMRELLYRFGIDPLHMNKFSRLLALVLLAPCAGFATTVIPPTFDDLVDRAQLIFQGTVTEVRSQWVGEGAERHIASYVTFNVDDKIKGNAGNKMTLELMGGTVGDETMEVTDAPKFKVGDRDILFVENNGTQFIPLVGIMHGRFHLKKDDHGREVVVKHNGAPLSDVSQLGKNDKAASAGRALSPQEFKEVIQQRAARPHPNP
jgi:hypothetical protein